MRIGSMLQEINAPGNNDRQAIHLDFLFGILEFHCFRDGVDVIPTFLLFAAFGCILYRDNKTSSTIGIDNPIFAHAAA